MRLLIGIGAAALLFAACSQPSHQATADQAASNGAPPIDAPTVQAAAAPAAASYNRDFPTGFQPTFEYSIRSRKVEESEGGPLRKLVIEFKSGDAASVDKQIEQLLIGKGYKRYKTIERGTDLVGDYGKNGKRITVTTAPANGALQLSEGALGTVYFVWKD